MKLPCFQYNSRLWLLVHVAPLADWMGARLVGLAAVFYTVLCTAAVVLSALRGREVFSLGDSALFATFMGIVTACGTVALGTFLYRLLSTLQRLSDELAPYLVDAMRGWDLILVSVFSGVGEEAFFRGALQPELGLVATSVLFGALHIGPDRRYLVWTLWAVGAGFLFGSLYEWTGGLLAPMIAHVLHNAATLLFWKRNRRRRLRTPRVISSEGGAGTSSRWFFGYNGL